MLTFHGSLITSRLFWVYLNIPNFVSVDADFMFFSELLVSFMLTSDLMYFPVRFSYYNAVNSNKNIFHRFYITVILVSTLVTI